MLRICIALFYILLQCRMEPIFPRSPDATRGYSGSVGFRSRIGRGLAFLAIAVIRAVAPLAMAWVGFRLVGAQSLTSFLNSWRAEPARIQAIDVWALAEVAFLGASLWRARRLSQRRLPLAFPKHERKAGVFRVIDHVSKAAARTGCIDPTDGARAVPGRCDDDCPHMLLRGWMHGAPWSSLAQPHSQAWLAWALFSSPLEELSPGQQAEVDEAHEMLLQVSAVFCDLFAVLQSS